MNLSYSSDFNGRFDLIMDRTIDIPPHLVWQAWTHPGFLKKWFAPAPWTTVECDIDLRPGGIFRTVMRSPEGRSQEVIGCYLEIVPDQKLVWTNALLPGFRPNEIAIAVNSFFYVAIVTLKPQQGGTDYMVQVRHGDEVSKNKHEVLGFYNGWSKALDQLIVVAKSISSHES
jgi:uncharacterized protein YndB with AHSA1/START domain